MSLAYLLDTSVLSAPMAKEPDRRLVKKLEQLALRCAVPSPVWHELIYGCSRLPAGKRRAALEEYLEDIVRRTFPILPYDDAAAEWHGRERARLDRGGRTPPFVDGQIAAIARTRSLALVTANVSDFEQFDGLEVVDWGR